MARTDDQLHTLAVQALAERRGAHPAEALPRQHPAEYDELMRAFKGARRLREQTATRPDRRRRAPRASLFIPELDGDTFASLEELADYHWHNAPDDRDDYDAEMAYERHLETNDRYAWEDEQDRLRAAFFGGAY